MSKKIVLGGLSSLPGLVNRDYNPFEHVLSTDSPSFNWLFANTHGLPLGYSVALIGPSKGGKTLIANNFIAKLQRDDPEAWVLKFDTEFRSEASLHTALNTGIDMSRVILAQTNIPSEIFDVIEKEIPAFQQNNDNKMKLLVIDSLSMIGGRRKLNSDTVDQQQIGDEAATLTDGLKRILPIIRRNKVAMICTVHVRAEMDRIEIMRGHTLKANMPWLAKHALEYYVFIEQNQTKDGRIVNEEQSDMKDNSLQTGHKIFSKITENSFGPKNRVAEFTLDYKNGIINVGTEVAELAKQLGVITMPNNRTYVFDGEQWSSRAAFEDALTHNAPLREKMITAIKRTDLNIVKL